MSIGLIIWLVCCHWVADSFLRWTERGRKDNIEVMAAHALIYGGFFWISFLLVFYPCISLFMALLLGLSHFGINYAIGRWTASLWTDIKILDTLKLPSPPSYLERRMWTVVCGGQVLHICLLLWLASFLAPR